MADSFAIKADEECAFDPVVICEVEALIKYASERGLDSQGVILKPLYAEVQSYKALPKNPEDPATRIAREKQGTEILILYVRLTELTCPVNGRTLVETEEKFLPAVIPLYAWTGLFLAIVIANEVMKVWSADIVEPEEGWLLHLINVRRYVLDVCAPFLWGALGSCVWLLKRLSDYAEARTFDRALSQGWMNRILLGAILGGIVQYLYDPTLFTSSSFKLGASALGFLTGVGVKVVYGAIEKSIDIVASKLNLDAKAGRNDAIAVRAFLSDQLGKLEKEGDLDRRKFVLAMLDDVKDQKKPE